MGWYGITHCGLYPTLLPIEKLVPNVFHMHSGIYKTMLFKTRKIIDTQAVNIKNSLSKKLFKQCKSWDSYHVSVWDCGNNFNGFIGKDL